MFDDLRNEADFIEEEPTPAVQAGNTGSRRQAQSTFLGMNALQRFILSLLIFIIVCVLGSFALIFTGTVVLPF